ncbi:type IV pilin [Halorubrum sp. PV6]|uniref:type IV pilin n=1 Tax=Halorubrum sp. PV6 TaxID=634157 RepID=UPI000F854200|nr:type IV pilin N-terminal domain-containing protein [Halorubrum sp. PV6]AZQ15757.1 type IV pilin [Halorubrum sp. PV6]
MKLQSQSNAEDRAVSPVIGVILMVAITVILAAVIGTFVLGLGESVDQGATAGISYDANSSNVTVISLGPNTETVACGSADSVNNSSAVGGEFSCAQGSNVVAVTPGGEATVIRTDLGN